MTIEVAAENNSIGRVLLTRGFHVLQGIIHDPGMVNGLPFNWRDICRKSKACSVFRLEFECRDVL